MAIRYDSVEFLNTKEFLSMKELAVLLGSTQKRIGLELEECNLWVIADGPTTKAIEGGYVSLRYYPNLDKYPLTVWHREKTIAALKAAIENEYEDEEAEWDSDSDSDSEHEDLIDENDFHTFTNN
jgi:hypothetical protein